MGGDDRNLDHLYHRLGALDLLAEEAAVAILEVVDADLLVDDRLRDMHDHRLVIDGRVVLRLRVVVDDVHRRVVRLVVMDVHLVVRRVVRAVMPDLMMAAALMSAGLVMTATTILVVHGGGRLGEDSEAGGEGESKAGHDRLLRVGRLGDRLKAGSGLPETKSS